MLVEWLKSVTRLLEEKKKKMASDPKSPRMYLNSEHWLLCNFEQLI